MSAQRQAPSPGKHITKGNAPWHSRLPWIYCCAALLLFASWIVEKYVAQDWAAQRDRLDRIQAAISTNEILANGWFLAMRDEERRRPPDKRALAEDALQYVAYSATILTLAVARLQESDSVRAALIASKYSYLTETQDIFREGRYDEVIKRAGEAREIQERTAVELNRRHTAAYGLIANSEAKANVVFRAIYILGSLVAAGAFLKEKLARSRTGGPGVAV